MSKFRFSLLSPCLLGLLAAGSITHSALAGEADVVGVKVSQTDSGVYRFDVTVRHGDEGWTHFADRWQVIGPGGALLGDRLLSHPHVNEQPFTRSLFNVEIPPNLSQVQVRARDLVHGYGGVEKTVVIPK